MENTFLSNYSNIRFIDKIKDCFNKCNAFYLSVSFIKKAGLILIERELEEALKRGAEGKIITSTYQNFTDIASLKFFNELMTRYPNFKCHLDFNCFFDNGYHSKGYLFEFNDNYEFIVGSSNITRYALLKNIEWNISLTDKTEFSSYSAAKLEFNDLFSKTLTLNEELIKKYSHALDYAIEKWDMDYYSEESSLISPNFMQRKALKELRRNRDLGVKRSLVIAATGSGKTLLAAFDAKNFDAKRLLFVVHRDTILIEAKKSFEKIFTQSRTYGIYNGKYQEITKDFIFASSNMLYRHLNLFNKDEFDYLILDECHHICADTYKKILNYFKPEFTLGLTATPERTDNQDIFSLFENNVPFELRLRDAIINDLVVPFHYYGIRDEFADYSAQDKDKIARELSKAINCEFIAKEIEKHKKIGEKLKCIAFCASIDHAKLTANQLNLLGYKTVSLVGSNDLGDRIKAFRDLQDETNNLEIICTVDILNEGVDIPAVNMVLFLRPTESQTIFLQQLGRGLRKYENKEYLTVLDFIGNNYERSVQIALALGTLSKSTFTEKAYLKDLITSDFADLAIPGVNIFIDELSKIEMINYINKTNFNKPRFLEQDYLNFKKYLKLDTYPKHLDYLDSDIAPDLMRFLKAKIDTKNKSYYQFLKKINEENIPTFNDEEVKLIDNISDYLPLVRADEYLIIRQLLNESLNLNKLLNLNYHSKVTRETLEHALYMLNKKIIINNKLNVSNISLELRAYLEDLLEYGLTKFLNDFSDYSGDFKLMGNYYKEQIQLVRLKLGLQFMKGTEFVDDVTYCYVNLKKDESVEQRLNYKDKFLDSTTFQWESEKNTTFNNTRGKKILNTKVVHLFVRKVEREDGINLPFTYFGTGKFINIRESYTEEKSKRYPTLLTDIILDNKVDKEYYLDFNILEEDEII